VTKEVGGCTFHNIILGLLNERRRKLGTSSTYDTEKIPNNFSSKLYVNIYLVDEGTGF
jgi:hypothetical protein